MSLQSIVSNFAEKTLIAVDTELFKYAKEVNSDQPPNQARKGPARKGKGVQKTTAVRVDDACESDDEDRPHPPRHYTALTCEHTALPYVLQTLNTMLD